MQFLLDTKCIIILVDSQACLYNEMARNGILLSHAIKVKVISWYTSTNLLV
jgi:hypothetical protein